ncbi:anion transporter [Thermocladium modestius]|uniref:Anion transporter n=1 Tax=Thermocladium modestius TaxID=62609 RepID=A0A830GZE8_9CREN|nr:SLC13 family permease [Thermocladium modestius]GGP22248.1 anion transporter [Thermocladium modestius]
MIEFLVDLLVLLITYGLIAMRGTRFGVPPWTAMMLGASLTILTGIVPPSAAFSSINLNVLLFLISLFTIASALEVSGFFSYVAYRLLRSGGGMSGLITRIFLSSAFLSMVLSNDGIAGSMAPVLASMRSQANVDSKPLLYALAFGVTIGSVAMPIGNPQNLLIALDAGVAKPFLAFIVYLLPPTLINMALTPYVLVRMFGANHREPQVVAYDPPSYDKRLAHLALIMLAALIVIYMASDLVQFPSYVTPVTASIGAASLLYVYSPRRRDVAMNLDWTTILFFIGLFIVSEGALRSGVLHVMARYLPSPTNLIGIFVAGILISQVISNVPMVAIYVPLMQGLGLGSTNVIDWMALAASSTIAGNLTIMGAASNVIASEAFERRGGEGFGFLEFIKYGAPLTAINVAVYYAWLTFMPRIII